MKEQGSLPRAERGGAAGEGWLRWRRGCCGQGRARRGLRARWWGEGSRVCIKPHVPFVTPGLLLSSPGAPACPCGWLSPSHPPRPGSALLQPLPLEGMFFTFRGRACPDFQTHCERRPLGALLRSGAGSSWAFLGGRRPADADRPNAPCLATGGLLGSSSPSPRSRS